MEEVPSEPIESERLVCEKIAEPMPDIAGIGILLGFSAQAFISIVLAVWVFFLSKLGRLEVEHEEGTHEFASEKKRLDIVLSMLMVGNDIQMLTGTALLVTTFTAGSHADLYHLHLVYDTVSFVGPKISNCAALVCYKFITAKNASRTPVAMRTALKGFHRIDGLAPRFRVAYAYAILFLIITIMLLAKLSKWSLTSEELGHCYRTEYMSIPASHHPYTDQAYVAVTAIWLLSVMFGTIFGSIRWRKVLLAMSVVQFPLHLYFMIALRSANMPHLESDGDETEDNWDFGQTTATLLLCTALAELFLKGLEYYSFEKDLKKYGPERANRNAEMRAEIEKEKGGRVGPVGVVVDTLLEASRSHPRFEHGDVQGGYELTRPLTDPSSGNAFPGSGNAFPGSGPGYPNSGVAYSHA